MAKKEVEKNYSVKNYIALFLIFVVSIGIVVYLCNVYKVYEDSKLEVPVISGSLTEIKPLDLEHYVIDTPSVIVYMCIPSDSTCRSFEKKLKKYIQKKDIVDEIVYLNLGDTDIDDFVTNFNNRFKYKGKLKKNFPAFVTFTDGEIDVILQGTKDKSLSISKVESLIDLFMTDEDEEEEEVSNEENLTENIKEE